MKERRWAAVIAVVVVVAIVVGLVWLRFSSPPSVQDFGPLGVGVQVTNLTSQLGGSYSPGAIQSLGANESAILLGGIGVYHKPQGTTLPVLTEWTGSPGAVHVTNVTSTFSTYFWYGGIYGIVWNGSAWLMAGEATYASYAGGTAIAYSDGVVKNLTGLVAPYFAHGGIWAVGWNGTSWLLGGNDTAGPVLLSLTGSHLVDLSSILTPNRPGDWVQLVAWNGSAWIVGGKGVFGSMTGIRYTDLFPQAGFLGGGVWSAGWNGSAWVVGGGAPAAVGVVKGNVVTPGPTLPAYVTEWIDCVAPFGSVWILGGKGTGTSGTPEPALLAWNSSASGSTVLVDLSSHLPGAFDGGQIQGGGLVPLLGANSVLLVGQGWYDSVTGYSLGAVALLTVLYPG